MSDQITKVFEHVDFAIWHVPQANGYVYEAAGIAIDDPSRKPSGQSLDAWRETFEVNVFGLVAVTNAFLPLLHASKSARMPMLRVLVPLRSVATTPVFASPRVTS